MYIPNFKHNNNESGELLVSRASFTERLDKVEYQNILLRLIYKQKRGRTNNSGSRNGMMVKLSPQVQHDPIKAQMMMKRIEQEIMKQPPLFL